MREGMWCKREAPATSSIAHDGTASSRSCGSDFCYSLCFFFYPCDGSAAEKTGRGVTYVLHLLTHRYNDEESEGGSLDPGDHDAECGHP